MKHGGFGFNLASKLSGMSELGARLVASRSTTIMESKFLAALFVTWSITRPGALPAIGLFGVLTLLMISHALMVLFDKHKAGSLINDHQGVSVIALSGPMVSKGFGLSPWLSRVQSLISSTE